MLFDQFAQQLQILEKTSSRLDMTSLLAKLFLKLDSEEVPPACYLMQGQLVPSYQSLEFNMSEKLTTRVLAKLLRQLDQDKSLPDVNLFEEQDDSLYQQKIQQKYKQTGDLGLAIEQLLSDVKTLVTKEKLSVLDVYFQLKQIAEEEGEGSQDRKINKTYELLAKMKPLSMRYVVRIIVGSLRLGFSTMTMIDALSWAQHQDKSDSKSIEKAYQKKADIGKLAQGYLQCQSQQEIKQFLEGYELEVGIPVIPALCQRLNTTQEIVEKMDTVIVEPKYDGLRAQIHIDKNNKDRFYQVFTRNLDDVTHMFPEIKDVLSDIKADQCILDSEAIAYDKNSGELLAFQQTITRRRKHDVQAQSETTPIKFYVFDILFKDGESLINYKLQNRKKILAQLFEPNQVLAVTDFIISSNPEEISQYHQQQLDKGLEGAVVKQVDSLYRGGRKGWRWVKLKEKEGSQGKLSDTLDCIVMGYYKGRGKRAKFGIGAFLVGVLTKDKKIKTIAKIGTGLTDDQFRQMKKLADKHSADQKPKYYEVPKDLTPDVWTHPDIVVEIAADEITKSPLHTAGHALRFPRLIGFRPDKDWEQATTLEEFEQIK
jgi:DNA ligase-1